MLTQQRTEPALEPAVPSSRRGLTLVLLSIAFFLSLLDRQILTVLVEPLQRDLKISDTQFGLIQGAAFAVFYIALAIPVATLADRWNRKLIITGGLFLWSASTVMAAFARSFGALFGARIGVGLGEACLAPAAYSMFADLYEKKSLSRAIGVFHAVGALGIAGAVIIGGILYQHFETLGPVRFAGHAMPAWGLTLVTVGMPGIVLAALIFLFVREPVRLQQQRDAAAAQAANTVGVSLFTVLFANGGAFARLLLGSALLSIAGNALLTWGPAYLMRTFELPPAIAGMRMGLAAAAGAIIGPLVGGFAADKLYARVGDRGTILVIVISSLILTVCYAGFAFASTANAATLVIALVSTLFSSALAVSASAIQLQAPSNLRARVSALWLCLNTLVGLGLGALLVGLVTDQVFGSPKAVGQSLAIVAIVSAVLGAIVTATLLRRAPVAGAGEAVITSRP